MTHQTIAVRYQSRGGNTKAVAEAIAKEAGVTAEPISIPIPSSVDILFIGGGVYAWDIDKQLKAFLSALAPPRVKRAAVFTTAAMMDKTDKIVEILKAQGITVCKETLPMKLTARNYAGLGGQKGITLSQKEQASIQVFVKRALG